ncbi:hypothetical protein C2W62_19375 [Candidatus Entotheonella serta]|nr:hypothetical protein C2W62_19375 [Candidatus Entotheonella serta]
MTPERLVEVLNRIFNDFDELSFKYGLEKIKTIGDSYMVCAGVPTAHAQHAQRIANMALEMLAKMPEINRDLELDFKLRIGIHSGAIVAGVIGKSKFAYDMWGDTVNTASRMESTSMPNTIQVSSATYELLYNKGYHFEARGEIDGKGKGKMATFFLTHRLQPCAELRTLTSAMCRPERLHNSLVGSVSTFNAHVATVATTRRHHPQLITSAG